MPCLNSSYYEDYVNIIAESMDSPNKQAMPLMSLKF